MERTIKLLVNAWLTLTVASTIVWAGGEKLSPELRQPKLATGVEVIVRYKVPPTEAHYRRVEGRGGKTLHRYGHINAGHFSISSSDLAALAADPDVEYIAPNRALSGMATVAAP